MSNSKGYSLILVLLFVSVIFILVYIFINTFYSNTTSEIIHVGSNEKDSSEKILVVSNKGAHLSNSLVSEPVEYKIFNNSESTIYYLGSAGGYINPTTCTAWSSGCEIKPQEPHAGFPINNSIEPGGMVSDSFYSLNLPEKFRIVFRYDFEKPNITNEELFNKTAKKAYSDILHISDMDLSKKSTLEICESLKDSESCMEIYYREFGDENHPIEIYSLVERKDLLKNDKVYVKAKTNLGSPDAQYINKGAYVIFARLKDSRGVGTYTNIYLYENGDFIRCYSDVDYVKECKGWQNGQIYEIYGRLRKGELPGFEDRLEYYIDVVDKKELE